MFKQTGKFLDPILIIGLLISLAISVGMVATSNDNLPGFTIGLLSTIITLLVDLIARLEKAKSTLLEASELSNILSNEAVGITLREIASAYGVIKKYKFDHYLKITDTTLNDCRARFRELASGSVIVQSKTSLAYGYLGTQQAKRDIKVVTTGSMDYWNSDSGKRVLATNKSSVKQGVQITRVFAIPDDAVILYLENLTEQERAGIRVFIVAPHVVDHHFMIFDERVLVDFNVGELDGKKLERIVVDTTQVQRKTDEFQNLIVRYGKTVKQITAAKQKAG